MMVYNCAPRWACRFCVLDRARGAFNNHRRRVTCIVPEQRCSGFSSLQPSDHRCGLAAGYAKESRGIGTLLQADLEPRSMLEICLMVGAHPPFPLFFSTTWTGTNTVSSQRERSPRRARERQVIPAYRESTNSLRLTNRHSLTIV